MFRGKAADLVASPQRVTQDVDVRAEAGEAVHRPALADLHVVVPRRARLQRDAPRHFTHQLRTARQTRISHIEHLPPNPALTCSLRVPAI